MVRLLSVVDCRGPCWTGRKDVHAADEALEKERRLPTLEIVVSIDGRSMGQEETMKISLKALNDQVVVITGASSGIGLCTAEAAAEAGAKLVLVARSEQ